MALTLCEPCLIDRIQQLSLDGRTLREIAKELGVTEMAVLREIDRHVLEDLAA